MTLHLTTSDNIVAFQSPTCDHCGQTLSVINICTTDRTNWESNPDSCAHLKPMTDFQQRVVQEEFDLDQKIEKLHVFIEDSPVFKTLPRDEQNRLGDQRCVMRVYRGILRERIAAFS